MTDFLYNGEFYDADYFERGRQSGKGWLENYRWMPLRSFREALAFIEYLRIDRESFVVDIGCAKGFMVRAMRMLEINCEGCDISEYALQFAPGGCWNCEDAESWKRRENRYTHAVLKDVLEHCSKKNVVEMLCRIRSIARKAMCVIPLGDDGRYRIKEYHLEISHQIAENEEWWFDVFKKAGWNITKSTHYIDGLKNHWREKSVIGNLFLIVERV